jgi:hypothetical protein
MRPKFKIISTVPENSSSPPLPTLVFPALLYMIILQAVGYVLSFWYSRYVQYLRASTPFPSPLSLPERFIGNALGLVDVRGITLSFQRVWVVPSFEILSVMLIRLENLSVGS